MARSCAGWKRTYSKGMQLTINSRFPNQLDHRTPFSPWRFRAVVHSKFCQNGPSTPNTQIPTRSTSPPADSFPGPGQAQIC